MKINSPLKQSRHTQSGFSMIEILIALVILAVNIMGVTALVVRTVQQEAESYQRIEALVLLQDMVDRINANRQVVSCYSDGATGRTMGHGESNPSDCGTSTAQNQADQDLLDWHNSLLGSSVQQGADNVGAMIGARGCIIEVNTAEQIYRVTVAWQGLSPTTKPSNTCGQNQYGDGEDDNYRRTVTALVRIGDLS